MFLTFKFFGKGPSKFWAYIIKFRLLLIIVQNFMPICRRTSEISRWKRKKHLQ